MDNFKIAKFLFYKLKKKSRNLLILTIPKNSNLEHWTIHAINQLTADVCWALKNKKCVGACLIEKAFDTVGSGGLIY